VRLHFEGELGRNDNPFTPISLRNYHAIRSRVQYRKNTMTLGGGYQENYNNNSIVITAYSSHARTYSAEASWTAKSWVSLDGSYSKMHLDTIGGIDFFAGSPRAVEVTGMQSIYISNIHAANLGLRFALTKRADLYVGYNITKDTGDGRSTLATQPTAIAQVFYNVQTFPLTYQTPLLRLSVRLTERLRYNLGYQYYGYHEDFGLLSADQNYRAQTGYTSLLWSF
jgi:predicted porin